MNKRSFIIVLLASIGFASCKQKVETQPQEEVVLNVKKEVVKDTTPIADKEGIIEYKTTRNGHTYTIVVERKVDKEAPIVEDILGTFFYDNCVHVSVKQDGAAFYYHVFRKPDFDHMLSDEDRQYGTLAGMSLDEDDKRNDRLSFFAQVCMPGMDGGLHAKVILSLQTKKVSFEIDDTPDLDIDFLHEEEEGV